MGVLLLCLVICMQALIGTVGGGRPPAMYAFGSSILDVGNNNYLLGAAVGRANNTCYGIDFPGSIPTGRFSNGYNIADYVAKNIGFACSPPPYLSLAESSVTLAQTALANGINYASGGAGILDSTARNRSDADQRKDAATLYAGLISNYSATVTELYSLGARKFALINIWLLGCVPGKRVLSPTGACSDILNEVVAGFNEALGSLLVDLAVRLLGLVYSLGDSFGFTKDTLANPWASGYTDIASTCCGGGRLGAEASCMPNSTLCTNRDQHVFWDRFHPSQRTAFLIAQAFYDGPPKYTTPINFMQLAQSTLDPDKKLIVQRPGIALAGSPA